MSTFELKIVFHAGGTTELKKADLIQLVDEAERQIELSCKSLGLTCNVIFSEVTQPTYVRG